MFVLYVLKSGSRELKSCVKPRAEGRYTCP